MNQRRRLLNAAKKGDQKAVAKLFELYQVRVYNAEMVKKLNRQAGMHKQDKASQASKPSSAKRARGVKASHATKPKAAAKKHKK
ncbi:MAG TPA: hypothetical protein VFS39_09895 [Nitrospira sp.]|nr:hypothetical protein [Nitrospira sp.]